MRLVIENLSDEQHKLVVDERSNLKLVTVENEFIRSDQMFSDRERELAV